MHIETFASHEEMMAALREHQAHAMAGLHPLQAGIGSADNWVRFVDLDAAPPVVEFGLVFTDEKVLEDELNSGQGADRAVFNLEQTRHMREEQGLLYGMAWSRYNTDGEIGTTHKAEVWPIENRLFEQAQRCEWDVTQFDELGRFLLNLAFRGQKAHVLGKQAKS